MEIAESLARNGAVYLWYYLGSCLRYFVVAGFLYAAFHVWWRRRWIAHRIQAAFPRRAEVRHEIRSSLSAMAVSGLTGVLLYDLIQAGWTRTYFEVARYGWAYFAFSVVLGIVGYDAWFYWQHRLLHTRWWYRHAHSVHHRATNPTPFANFAHHPIEITLGNVYFILFTILVPVHPLAFALVSMFVFGWGMIAHLGYELYPKSFTSRRAFGWINSATHHNMHHSHVRCNYGMFFNHWDRLMGTNHPEYRSTFDAVRAARPADEHYRLAVGA
jgi:sterol desaturase/sphingolipid hydroxylase (fatty acid hydroxylase superfamily)